MPPHTVALAESRLSMLVETLNYYLAAHLWFDTSLFDGKVDLPLVFLRLLFLTGFSFISY
jgi:hypothetical protein